MQSYFHLKAKLHEPNIQVPALASVPSLPHGHRTKKPAAFPLVWGERPADTRTSWRTEGWALVLLVNQFWFSSIHMLWEECAQFPSTFSHFSEWTMMASDKTLSLIRLETGSSDLDLCRLLPTLPSLSNNPTKSPLKLWSVIKFLTCTFEV